MSTSLPKHPPHTRALAVHAPSVLAVGIGATIYLLWRSETLLVFDLVRSLELGAELAWARERVASFAAPAWLLTSAPDGLYAFALSWSLSASWSSEAADMPWRRVWMAVALLLTIGSECAQAVSVVPGAFDVLDLAFYALGGALGWRAAPVWLAFVTLRRTA